MKNTLPQNTPADKGEQMAAHAAEAAAFLKQMANENRLMILCALGEGEMSVGELNRQVPLSQSALSQHLAALREAGLVRHRQQAQTRFYRLSHEGPLQVISVLQSLFCPEQSSPPAVAVKCQQQRGQEQRG